MDRGIACRSNGCDKDGDNPGRLAIERQYSPDELRAYTERSMGASEDRVEGIDSRHGLLMATELHCR